jgi:hypothetical protein
VNEDFQMDPERVELFFARLLPDDELTLEEVEWLDDAVREVVMRRVKQQVH